MAELAELLKKLQELNKEKKYSGVIDLLTDSVLEDYKNADLYSEKANAYYELGERGLSNEAAEKAISIDPNNLKGLYYKAIYYSDNAEYQKAIEYYKKAVEINPKYESAYFGWGWVLGEIAATKKEDERDKYFLESIEKYKKATELNPWFDAAFYNWGRTLGVMAETKTGDEKQRLLLDSIEKYKKTIEIYPNNDSAYYGWGWSLAEIASIKSGKEKEKILLESIEKCERAIQINPNNDSAYFGWGFNLGEIAEGKSGNEKENLLLESIEKYKKVTEIIPKYDSAYHNWGWALGEIASTKSGGEKEKLLLECIEKYEKASQINPNYDSAFYGLGWGLGEIAAMKSGDEKQKLLFRSIKEYEKAIEINPKVSIYYYSLGSTYYEIYEYKKALSNYNKYVELTKRNPDYYTSVAESKIAEIIKLLKDSEYSHISELVNKIKELLYYKEGCITHYTGLSVAKALVIEGSLFRLSEGAFLNDTSEGRELFKFLSFDFALSKGSDTVATSFAQKPFIGSFVAEIKHDDLTLWRMYGKEDKEEAKGCALTIEIKKLVEDLSAKMSPDKKTSVAMSPDKKSSITTKTAEEFNFYRVAYRKGGEENSFIIPDADLETEMKLNDFMKELYAAVESFKLKKKINTSDTLNVLERLNEIAYLFKSAEYQHEFEIRLVLKGIGFEKIINKELKPPRVYIELVGIRPSIKKITLGPKVEKPDEWASAFYYSLGSDGHAPDILISHLPFK